MIVKDMPEREYHARPELSSTQARQLLESPARYKWALDHPQEPKAAFDVGTAAHTKILGVGAGIIAYPDEHLTASGNVSTKAATVAWAEDRRAEGLTPVSPDQIEAVDAMAEAVLAHPLARGLLEQEGMPAASVFGTCPDTGVDMRARFDYLAEPDGSGRRRSVDIKTTAKLANEDGFRRSIASYRYDVQVAHYMHTLGSGGHGGGDISFVVVEKHPPYLVAVHQLDPEFLEAGEEDAAKARRRLVEARESGNWPGYPVKIGVISPPMWLIYDRIDEANEEIRI